MAVSPTRVWSLLATSALAVIIATPLPARAEEAAPAPAPVAPAPAAPVPDSSDDLLHRMLKVDIHAFISQGYLRTFNNNYYVAQSTKGSFQFNEAAINLTNQPTDRLRIGIQLFENTLGNVPGAYVINADWFYLDYRFKDWLGIRIGRTKLPFGLYNEINEIDAARVPIIMPQSVYPLLNRNALLAQTGGELYGYIPLARGDGGALDYRLYGGTLFLPAPATSPAGTTITEVEVPYIGGARLLWETPLEGLRFGGSFQALRIDQYFTLNIPGLPKPLPGFLGLPLVLWLASIEYAAHDLILAAEYGMWQAHIVTSVNGSPEKWTLGPNNQRYYLSAAYRVTRWFTPGIYWSSYFREIKQSHDQTGSFQNDLVATLRFDVNAHWIIKVEGHYYNGTADLENTTFNGTTPYTDLKRVWGAVFAKTTVYF